MAGFYSARGRTIPPLPWPVFAPPLSRANVWAAEYLKTLKKTHEEKPVTDITKDYEPLTNHYADKWDVTPAAAGQRLIQDRPDLVAKAYETEQAAYVQRQIDKRNKVHPNG